jgi:hypothetical protein
LFGRFSFKWLLVSLALSVVLTLVVRALTGIWFLGFFLFLPLGLSFRSKSWGGGTNSAPLSPPTNQGSGSFNPTPYSQDELRQAGGTARPDSAQ